MKAMKSNSNFFDCNEYSVKFSETDFNVLKKKTIAHYNRMIKWAKKQISDNAIRCNVMFSEIQENWLSLSCPFCKVFDCELCPITINTKEGQCLNTPWHDMNNSETHEEWIKNAERMKQFIIDLKYPEGFYE